MKFFLFQHLRLVGDKWEIYRFSAHAIVKVTLMLWCWVLGLWFNDFPCLAADGALRSKLEGIDAATFEEIETLVQKANTLHTSGDDREAIPVFEKALAKSIKAVGNDDPFVAGLQRALGAIYQAQADYSTSLRLYESSLATREKIFGPDHPEVANTLNSMASLYIQQGDHARALPLYERSLVIAEKSFGPEHETVAYALDGLASVYQDQGDFVRALALWRRSLTILEKVFGPDDPVVATSLNNLAELYRAQLNISKSLPLFERSLVIQKQALGLEHPDTATTLNNLALLHQKEGHYAEALQLFQQSLAIREKLLGENHPDVAASLGNLARVYRELGDVTQALSMHRRSLEVIEKVFDGDHPYIAQSLMDLGVTLDYFGRDQEAIPLFRRALAMRERLLGLVHPDVADSLDGLGFVLNGIGKHTEALRLLERSLEIRERCFGKENPRVTGTLNGLAMAYHAQRNFERAGVFYRRSLDIAENSLGTNSPIATAVLENLALLALDAGETQQGVSLFDEWFRRWRTRQASELSNLPEKYAFISAADNLNEISRLHSVGERDRESILVCANQLALGKAFFEEVQATQAALECDPRTAMRELREQHQERRLQLFHLSESKLAQTEREATRLELQTELARTESQLAERVGLIAQAIRERNLTLSHIARSLPQQSVLVDFIEYTRYDFAANTNRWKEQRYAAYLTFPLAFDSTNVVVERVDFGETVPLNESVEQITKLMASGQIAPKRLQPVLQRLSDLVYAPLAKHLTNVSHLIVCPDGQLSRVPFEMLLHDGKYLIETKTISYVTSGREIVRLASDQSSPKSKVQRSKSLIMGDPDFDFDLQLSSRREPLVSKSEIQNPKSEIERSLLTSAATKYLSRSARGLKFTRLPSAAVEAKSVASLLGKGTELRLGKEAREADLKAVVSPRVLHLATHGFFLSDQEFKYTNSFRDGLLRDGLASADENHFPARRSLASPENDWENPLVRCGIALAGANHSLQITNALAEDGLLTGLEASLLNLQGTELVVLSACDSGTGDIKIGEGVMSLRRAFRIAGAETVLASHWKVSDKATSQLMTEFMRRWRGGEPRVQAWREAQLTLLRSKEFSNPYFWAAFTLTGQWR